MRRREIALFLLLTAASVPGLGQGGKPRQNNGPARATASKSEAERWQQVFRENCSRCHKAPETFPQSVSGTVALHMRVRAGLSEREYKALLTFLNP